MSVEVYSSHLIDTIHKVVFANKKYAVVEELQNGLLLVVSLDSLIKREFPLKTVVIPDESFENKVDIDYVGHSLD